MEIPRNKKIYDTLIQELSDRLNRQGDDAQDPASTSQGQLIRIIAQLKSLRMRETALNAIMKRYEDQEWKPDTTIPELPETLQAQVDSLQRGTIPVVMFPESTLCKAFPPLPPGMEQFVVKEGKGAGVYYYNPRKIEESQILEAVRNGAHGKLLGHIQDNMEAMEGGNPVVVQAVREGIVVQDSLVDGTKPELVQAQAEVLKERHPGSMIRIRVGLDALLDRLGESLDPD